MNVTVPKVPQIKHHVDPVRYPRIQGQYESQAKKSFHAVELFENLVKTMVDIVKEKKK
jgi:hypothetical protein